MKIFFATNNQNKIKEAREILAGTNIYLYSPKDLGLSFKVFEDGTTFQENAYKKAFEGLRQSGMISLGEDSGLLVDYLKARPGIYSSRFAGKDRSFDANLRKVLKLLKGVSFEKRKARFKCVICLALSFKKHLFFEGECTGFIAEVRRGNLGFGYDPIFIPKGYNLTFGELGAEVKNKISHRAKALRKLKEYLQNLLALAPDTMHGLEEK